MRFPEIHRVKSAFRGFETKTDDPFGAFMIPGRVAKGRVLQVIACDGEETGWEHVSVSLSDNPGRCPSWEEMCVIKDLFWEAEEAVMQLHPPQSDYVNQHPGCLHLWRPVPNKIGALPLPPSILVGEKAA